MHFKACTFVHVESIDVRTAKRNRKIKTDNVFRVHVIEAVRDVFF